MMLQAAVMDGTNETSFPSEKVGRTNGKLNFPLRLEPWWFSHWTSSQKHVTLMEKSSKAYEHDPNDFDYYVSHPTAEDLPDLLDRFDNHGQDVWPWIWTHPNENGPHHVFVGKNIDADIVRRIQYLREESSRNNILILIQDDEESLKRVAASAGMDERFFDKCHCGVVTGVTLELLNATHKILMLDDERVVAFDYLTIC
jgi:hypothetical protein